MARICGWCGGPDYYCRCRERDARSLRAALVLALVLVAVLARSAAAQDSRPPHVVAASVCWVEASFAEQDCAALLHVLLRRAERAGVDLVAMSYRYTAIRRDHARAQLARQLADGDEPAWTAAINRRWAALRVLARGVLDGSVADPCPGSTQWGGLRLPHDLRRARAAVAAGRWVQARCAGQTANTFFREVAP